MGVLDGRIGRLSYWGLMLILAGLTVVGVKLLLPDVLAVQDPYAALPDAAKPYLPPDAVVPILLTLAFLGFGHAILNIFLVSAVLFVLITLEGVRADFAGLLGLEGSAWLGDAVMIGALLIVLNLLALVVMAKRCHDSGFTAWRTLVTALPFIGPIWMILDLGLMGGDEHANVYDGA